MMLSHPSVEAIHDVHAWALATQEPILTAHIVLASATDDVDKVRGTLAAALDEQFGIAHATLQVERFACTTETFHV